MPSPQDERDRKEAARLLLAAAIAILLLIVIGAVGIYFITGLGDSDPFSAGLGLKGAAIVSFGVSLVLDSRHGDRVRGRCDFRRAAIHHRGLFDLLRDLLADDRLDLLIGSQRGFHRSGSLEKEKAAACCGLLTFTRADGFNTTNDSGDDDDATSNDGVVVMMMVTVTVVVVIMCRRRCCGKRAEQQAQPYDETDQKPLHDFLLVIGCAHNDSPARSAKCRDKRKRKVKGTATERGRAFAPACRRMSLSPPAACRLRSAPDNICA